jgi:glycosyltransferase involved in cell wall biosynthesis
MKILSLSTCPLDPLLGSGKTRLRWTEGLRELGHSVEVAEPRDYETWHGMRRAIRFRQAWGACGFVKRKLESESFDLIEFFGGEFGLITRQLASMKRRPLVVAHTDGLELLASERERAYDPPQSFIERAHAWYAEHTHERLSRAAFVYADAFVTGCELDREYVLEHGIFERERTAVVQPGIDDGYLAMPFIGEKQHRVAYTGSWIARKGIKKLAAVMTELMTRDGELRFDIYGTGEPRDQVLSCFPRSLHDRIEVSGRLTNAALAEAMSRAKVFFFPSQYEGFGMALGEAMACGCAAVTTPTGFGAELRDGVEALVCGFDDLEAMKQSVERLLTDEATRLAIARAGWERVRELSWRSRVRKLEATYESWLRAWKNLASPATHAAPQGDAVHPSGVTCL